MSDAAGWRESSHSANVNQNRVAVAPVWRKSSFSGGAHQDCVEIAPILTRIGIRDTKNRDNGHLLVPTRQWHRFIGSIKHDAL